MVLTVEKHMNFGKEFAYIPGENNNYEGNEEIAAAFGAPPSGTAEALPGGYVTPPPGAQRARNNIPTLEEELRRFQSPFHNMIRAQHAQLAALRARGVSPNTIKYARQSHLEERRRKMNSPLPAAPPPPPPERHIPLRELTREQLNEKHRKSLDYASRAGSPEFLKFTKEWQEKEVRNWEAAQVGKPPAAAAAAAGAAAAPRGANFQAAFRWPNNNNNNNNENEEAAFGSLGPLNRNRNYYSLTGIGKRRERNTRKQRKTRRSKSRRNRRYTRR